MHRLPAPESALQNNEHIRGALIVGILRVAKAGWLSGVNNLAVNALLACLTMLLN